MPEIAIDFRMTLIERHQTLRFSESGRPGGETAMDILASFKQNRILAALPAADLALLTADLRETHFEQGVLLQEMDDPIQQVHFPHNGMISLLVVMSAGNGVETATIGREGAVNVMAGLGSRHSASRAVMQVAGDVSQITASKFRAAVERSAVLRSVVVQLNDVQIALAQQTAGCNALHHVEKCVSAAGFYRHKIEVTAILCR